MLISHPSGYIINLSNYLIILEATDTVTDLLGGTVPVYFCEVVLEVAKPRAAIIVHRGCPPEAVVANTEDGTTVAAATGQS